MKIFQEALLSHIPFGHICARTLTGQFRPTYAHWHNEVEIIYTRKGYATQQINSNFFMMSPGSIAIVGQNQIHSYASFTEEEDSDVLVVQFDVEELLSTFDSQDRFRRDWCSGQLLFTGPVVCTSQMELLLDGIDREIQARDPGYLQVVYGSLLQLLTLFYRASPASLSFSQTNKITTQGIRQLSDFFVFLAEHYHEEDFTLEKAAAAAILSVTHFCRLFKQTTGTSFHAYLTEYRIIQAEQQFHTKKCLEEIACSCGFGSLSSFSRNYKSLRGQAPSQARKTFAQKNTSKEENS